jgi:hypothetical protein
MVQDWERTGLKGGLARLPELVQGTLERYHGRKEFVFGTGRPPQRRLAAGVAPCQMHGASLTLILAWRNQVPPR